MDKERKEEILEKLEKAGSEEYETHWENGVPVSKKKEEIKKGKKSRASGLSFELKVRKDLEGKGWIVDKWSNNVNLSEGKIEQAKRKFNPFSKIMTIGTGFPDFICFQKMGEYYKIIGLEVKKNGILDKDEKEKCKWYLDNSVFNEIWVARDSGEIAYEDFRERWGKMWC